MNTTKKPLDELLELVTPKSLWWHTNGNQYVVLHIANVAYRHPNYPVTVVYQNYDNGTVWTRALADWERSFTLYKAGVPYAST